MIIGGSYEGAGYFGGQLFVHDNIAIFSDSISMSEVFSKTTSKGSFLDTITLSDTFSILKVFLKNLSDTITMVETVFTKSLAKSFSDVINMTSAFFLGNIVTFSEVITMSDTFSRLLSSIKVFNETITFTETFIKSTARSFLDNIVLSETFNALRTLRTIFNDLITISDTFAGGFSLLISRAFNDIITLSEEVLKYLNGMLQNWNKIPKPLIGIWNKIVKSNP